MGALNEKFELLDGMWEKIEHLLPPLKLFAEKMLQLQNTNATLSDMFGFWNDLKFSLKDLNETSFTKDLVHCLDQRENTLFDSPVLVASVYLDLRFKILLSPDQKRKAINHLRWLWTKICPSMDNDNDTTTNNIFANESENNPLQKYLNGLDMNPPLEIETHDFDLEIENYSKLRREGLNSSLKEIWGRLKCGFPLLNKLYEVISSISPTEVDVERNFSKLNFVVNRLRTNLSDRELEKILFISLNYDK